MSSHRGLRVANQVRHAGPVFFFLLFFYCLIERKHLPLEYFEIKDGGATVKAKARVRRGSVRR